MAQAVRAFVKIRPHGSQQFVAAEVYATEETLDELPHAEPVLEGWLVRVPGKKPIRLLTQADALELLLEG